ncbi:glycosyltransferase involved in cell wall biosynthesis [Candidatus Pelagibacter ubique]|uniref:Glycosyltransferase involved in cell wall biosynthesis n=1 Tax=Pelagibacter ubique TaxID=198252 RepID=A0ABX1T0E2_PELUQ|nr:glycosyltransferase family 1 protein [Candidatus Pelagibacter ubique]NMN67082.1 glycosyltransferase involved in cell wall biosynthesis [Candidatus Pelagibacter ubique]
MKIYFDYKIFLQQKFGGPSRYFSQLFENLNTNKKKAYIVSPFYINNYLDQSNFKENIYGKKIYSRRFGGKFYTYFNKKISKIIFSRLRPDLIHTTYYDHDLVSQKKPVVLTVYDLIHEIYSKDFAFKNYYRPKKNIIEKVDHFICISKNTQKDLINYYGVDEKKTSVIYLSGFDSSKKFSIKHQHSKPFLLFVGTRNRYKNFSLLIKAYSSENFINSNFDLICFGGGKFNKEELELFKDHNLDLNKIHQIEGKDEILISLYRSATAYVCTSFYEGFGLTLLEAMQQGCPVLSSNTSSLPEVYGDAALTFSPYSVEELRKSLNKITSADSTREELSKKGLKHAKNFTWEKCTQDTLKVYKSLI